MRILCVALLALVLTACAKRPDAIAPTAIPMDAYTNMSCDELLTLLATEQANLAALSQQQNNAATGDALGVFLIGVPVSSVGGGDKEGNIAVSKGKIQAIEAAKLRKGC